MVKSPQELNNISANQLNQADDSILMNLQLQLIICFFMLIAFFIVRKRNLWLYSPNTRKRRTHPAFKYTKTYVKFLFPLFFVDDVTMLSIIGLDAFMFLQVVKMMYRCFFLLSLFSIPLLWMYYDCAKKKEDYNLFVMFTIKAVDNSEKRLVPILYVYIITFVLFYLIYVYYKKYITLRQTYIRSPSLLTPLTVLKKASMVTGNYIDLVDIKSRTVMLMRIPPFVQDDVGLRRFVEALGCGEVEECALIIDNTVIDRYIDEKDLYVRDVETQIERAYKKIIQEIKEIKSENDLALQIFNKIMELDVKEETKEEKRNFEDKDEHSCNDSEETVSNLEKDQDIQSKIHGISEVRNEKNNGNVSKNNVKSKNGPKSSNDNSSKHNSSNNPQNNSSSVKSSFEKEEIGVKFALGANINAEEPSKIKQKKIPDDVRKNNIELSKAFVFSNNKYLKRTDKPAEIVTKLLKIDDLQQKIVEHVRNERYKKLEVNEDIIDMMNNNHSMYTKINLERDAPFFSISQFLKFRETFHFFTLDLPLDTRSGFITFKDQRSASIITQCLISSKIFSCKALPAPDPNDIIWENIAQSEVERFFKRIGGNIVNILFIGVFYTLVLGVANVMKIDQLEDAFPSIKFLTTNKFIRDAYNSAFMPFVFNQMMMLAPFILTVLIYYEGVFSYSELYYKLVVKHSYFLLFNGFIAMLFSATCFEVVLKIANGEANFQETAEDVAKNLIVVSVFFTNSIIQRTIGGLAFRLLKPNMLFFEYAWTRITASLFKTVRTRRMKKESKATLNINFGIEYPTTTLVFPMAMCYGVIAPVMLVFAGVYFFVQYFMFKHELLYCLENEFETGGSHWNVITNQMVLSLFIFHLATMCQYLLYDSKWELLLLIPVIIITYMFKNSMTTMFKKCTKNYPLNEQEEVYMDRFTRSVTAYRKQAVANWDQSLDPEDPDCVEIIDLLGKSTDEDDALVMAKLINEKDNEYKGKSKSSKHDSKHNRKEPENDKLKNDKETETKNDKLKNDDKDESNKDKSNKDNSDEEGKDKNESEDKTDDEEKKNKDDDKNLLVIEKPETIKEKETEISPLFDEESAMSYPYRGIVRGLRVFMFPNQFFRKLRFCRKIDKDDSLEIFVEKKHIKQDEE